MPKLRESDDGAFELAFQVPKVLGTAVIKPSYHNCDNYVSRKGINLSENNRNSPLTTENSAFFMGKIFPESFSQKIGFSNEDIKIYSINFIKGAIAYMKEYVAPGEKIVFLMSRDLSELCNGRADVEGAYSSYQQIELIKQIAFSAPFYLTETDIEIRFLEDSEEHMALFDSMRATRDLNNGELDLDLMFEKGSFSLDNPSSLDIAYFLYLASSESEDFFSQFKEAVPKKLIEEHEVKISSNYYALFEVAIRLWEILNGRYIHGGADRQEKYDGIIRSILVNNKKLRKIKSLVPVLDLFNGTGFETLHLSSEKNYFKLSKSAIVAKTKMAIYALLFLGALGSVYQLGVYNERKKQQEIEEMVDSEVGGRLDDLEICSYDFGTYCVENGYNLEIFNESVLAMENVFVARYSVPEGVVDNKFRALLKQYLIENREILSSFIDGYADVENEVDKFVFKNSIYLISSGLESFKPYAFLDKYPDEFENLRNSTSDLNFWQPIDELSGAIHIGTVPYKYGGWNYEFYLYYDWTWCPDGLILAKRTGESNVSIALAKEGLDQIDN